MECMYTVVSVPILSRAGLLLLEVEAVDGQVGLNYIVVIYCFFGLHL